MSEEMTQAITFEACSPLEQSYWQRYLALFSRVGARQPERGIVVLLSRSRKLAEAGSLSYEDALEQVYQGAVARTERRIALTKNCQLP